MSDNRSLHQKIRKFSKFITTKVKEKTLIFSEEEDIEEEEEVTVVEENEPFEEVIEEAEENEKDNQDDQEKVITRRHSSYVKRSSIEDSIFINTTTFNIKEDVYHYHTISSAKSYGGTPSSPTTPVSALSPPPRQPKSRSVKNQRKSFSSYTQQKGQPCLSRSNTLGENRLLTPDPPITSPSTSSLSSITHYNMNHTNTLIN